jgi:hypothetical protein
MSENEDRHVVHGIVAPPTLPTVVGPRSTNWTKHVAPDDPCSDTLKPSHDHIVVKPRRSTLRQLVHLVMSTRGKLPAEDRETAHSNRIGKILVGTGTVAVKRYRKAMDAKPGQDEFSVVPIYRL